MYQTHKLVMVDPHDQDHKKAEREGEKRRPSATIADRETATGSVLREMGNTNLKNEKGDSDRKYAIAECLHSGFSLSAKKPNAGHPD